MSKKKILFFSKKNDKLHRQSLFVKYSKIKKDLQQAPRVWMVAANVTEFSPALSYVKLDCLGSNLYD